MENSTDDYKHDSKANSLVVEKKITKEQINNLLESYEPSYFFSRATFLSYFGKQYSSYTTQALNKLACTKDQNSFTKQNIIDALNKKKAIPYRIKALSKGWEKLEKSPDQYLLEKGGMLHRNTGTNKLLVELIKYFHPEIAVTDGTNVSNSQTRSARVELC